MQALRKKEKNEAAAGAGEVEIAGGEILRKTWQYAPVDRRVSPAAEVRVCSRVFDLVLDRGGVARMILTVCES
jgi:hypothetical protein